MKEKNTDLNSQQNKKDKLNRKKRQIQRTSEAKQEIIETES